MATSRRHFLQHSILALVTPAILVGHHKNKIKIRATGNIDCFTGTQGSRSICQRCWDQVVAIAGGSEFSSLITASSVSGSVAGQLADRLRSLIASELLAEVPLSDFDAGLELLQATQNGEAIPGSNCLRPGQSFHQVKSLTQFLRQGGFEIVYDRVIDRQRRLIVEHGDPSECGCWHVDDFIICNACWYTLSLVGMWNRILDLSGSEISDQKAKEFVEEIESAIHRSNIGGYSGSNFEWAVQFLESENPDLRVQGFGSNCLRGHWCIPPSRFFCGFLSHGGFKIEHQTSQGNCPVLSQARV